MNMVYLIIIILVLSVLDIKEMKSKKQMKDMAVYIAFMLLVGTLGIFYFSNPEADSFSKIMLAFIRQKR